MAEHEPMIEVFIYETRQFLEKLEELALASETAGSFAAEDVNEIFRAMHTIKGSAAMLALDEISQLAHAVEDIFFYIRELHPAKVDVSGVTDLVLKAEDFMGGEIDKLDEGVQPAAKSTELRERTEKFLREMKLANGDDPDIDLRKVKKQKPAAAEQPAAVPAAATDAKLPEAALPAAGKHHAYEALLHFDPECGMLEVRAYAVIHALQEKPMALHWEPEHLLEDERAAEEIVTDGFKVDISTDMDVTAVQEELRKTSFLTGLELKEMPVGGTAAASAAAKPKTDSGGQPEPAAAVPVQKPLPGLHHEHETQVISVRVDKLDRLMDLVGELVISESMVIQNPDITGRELENFQKAARQLQKISSELQDSVMSLRMVPLEGTFKKMNRIVRDMTKKLGKKARLVLQGEDTEVDKSIIDHIGDPLMHIVRNSIDHGIEGPEERQRAGKPETGTVTLSASNEGGEVILRIKDDGSGLDREKILQQARQRHLFTKPEAELTDSEIYHFIFLPGFSTKEKVTEFSGRGVGMDVVVSNIRALGGNVAVESTPGQGSTTIIRIPLTLAIIDGMSAKVGRACFTIPISSISRSFRPAAGDVFKDAAGHEMFMEEGRCCPIMRLYERYGISEAVTDLEKGILIVIESRVAGTFAVMADMLLGVQEIVVKPVPKYISQAMDITGISGCTLLGDGNISLILDAEKLGRLI